MPIDGHAYLVKQGWGGKGTALRQGAISRPVTIAQKKTLSGVGKDRDEAFPFWDHVFEAAAMSIHVKVSKDNDDDSDSDATPSPRFELQRTDTGIISHRRPKMGTPALSGATTPDSPARGSVTSRLSVMAAAKQEAAKRLLYATFFRGPVLGSNDVEEAAVTERSPVLATPTLSEPWGTSFASKKKSRRDQERTRESLYEDVDTVQRKKGEKGSRTKNADEAAVGKEQERWERKAEETATDPDVDSWLDGERVSKRRRRAEEANLQEEQDFGGQKAEKVERERRKADKRAAKEERRRVKQQLKEASNVEVNDANLGGVTSKSEYTQHPARRAHAVQDASRKRKKRDKDKEEEAEKI